VASEVRRGFIRIISNYVRLFSTFVLGLVLIPLLLRTVGNDAFALISLLGSTVGISAMAVEIVRDSMIRELGAAHHHGDPEHFRRVYNSAIILSALAAVVTLLIFGLIFMILPSIVNIPDELIWPGRWFVATRGVYIFFTVLLAPQFNMYVVTERMVEANFWQVVSRLCDLLAVFPLLASGSRDIGHDVVSYGVLSGGLSVVSLWISVGVIVASDRRLVPSFARISWGHCRSLMKVGGWNLAVVSAGNMHERLDAVIMNWVFGLFGNLIFGLGVQFSSYIRMVATGITSGIDAVAARVSTVGHQDAIRTLVRHSTRLHGLVTFPSSLLVIVLADPLMRAWVGGRIEDPTTTLPATIAVVRVLCVGVTARAIGDGWVRILYGAGHIRRYAPMLLIAGLCDPILAFALTCTLPAGVRHTGPAWAYSVILVVAYLSLLPMLGGPMLGLRVRDLYAPLGRPLLLALICAPILIGPGYWLERWDLKWIVGVCAVYGVAYGLLAMFYVLEEGERKRLMDRARRLIGKAVG
jgi:O-antigen/teichoic acid export membrane protein